MRRQEALRKAMFESLMMTATYRVSNTIEMAGLSSHNFHFVANASTKRAMLADFFDWFVVMKLLTKNESEDYLNQWQGGGSSTCLIRTDFNDGACRALFFQSPGKLWDIDHYLDLGRRALRALLDPDSSDTERFRCELLDRHWADALRKGPVDELGPLVGLRLTDSSGQRITPYLRGDVYTIRWWANSMRAAGEAVLDMQKFLANANPATVSDSHEFASRRDHLQKKMADLISKSQTRFDDPWGLIALFWAAGSTGGSARLVANGLLVQRPEPDAGGHITVAESRSAPRARVRTKRARKRQ
jgi:hypothetical protein